MAVTGLILIAFLLVHMYGNLKMFVGYEAFDHYAEWLKGKSSDGGILYPVMPAGQFIWVFRAALLLAIVLHICQLRRCLPKPSRTAATSTRSPSAKPRPTLPAPCAGAA